MLNRNVSKDISLEIIKRLQQGVSIDQIVQDLEVSRNIIHYLNNDLAIKEKKLAKLERLDTIARCDMALAEEFKKNVDPILETAEDRAKQFAKWLIVAGMRSKQVYLVTHLSIHVCRHFYKTIKKAREVNTAALPLPTHLTARIIYSIFATHYQYLQSRLDIESSTNINIRNVFVAWMRTMDEVVQSGFTDLEKFDHRLLSLGTLFEIATHLRGTKGYKYGNTDERRLVPEICPVCGCNFVSFAAINKKQANRCPYCTLRQTLKDSAKNENPTNSCTSRDTGLERDSAGKKASDNL